MRFIWLRIIEMSVEKVTTNELEIAVVQLFNQAMDLILPNVMQSWMLDYEADLVMVNRSRYAYEVELKTSRADLKADGKKRHKHDAPIFKRLYFAMPGEIIDLYLIPERAGILSYKNRVVAEHVNWAGKRVAEYTYRDLELFREPTDNRMARKLTRDEIQKLKGIAYYRLWGLKRSVVKLVKEVKKLESELKESN